MNDISNEAPQFFFISKKGKIHYRQLFVENGDPAKKVCILPGFTMSSSLYLMIASELNKNGYEVVIADYWGRGFSEFPSDDDFSLGSYVDEVIMLMKHLNFEKCNLIGFSYGGVVAAGIALKKENIVDKLLLVSPLFFQKNEPSPLQKFTLGTSLIGPFILKMTASNSVPNQIEQQFCFPSRCDNIVKGATQICMKQYKKSWDGCSAISKSIADYDANEILQTAIDLKDINKKMMIIFGEQDCLIEVKNAKAWWGKWIPSVKINIIEDGGHLVFLENMNDTLFLLLDFLKN